MQPAQQSQGWYGAWNCKPRSEPVGEPGRGSRLPLTAACSVSLSPGSSPPLRSPPLASAPPLLLGQPSPLRPPPCIHLPSASGRALRLHPHAIPYIRPPSAPPKLHPPTRVPPTPALIHPARRPPPPRPAQPATHRHTPPGPPPGLPHTPPSVAQPSPPIASRPSSSILLLLLHPPASAPRTRPRAHRYPSGTALPFHAAPPSSPRLRRTGTLGPQRPGPIPSEEAPESRVALAPSFRAGLPLLTALSPAGAKPWYPSPPPARARWGL